MNPLLKRLEELFSPERVADYLLVDLLPDVIVAGAVLIAFYLFWLAMRKGIGVFMNRIKLDETAKRFVLTVVKFSMMTISVVTALSQLGINTGTVLASLGVAGLTIGFAAKDALSNLISGIFIF